MFGQVDLWTTCPPDKQRLFVISSPAFEKGTSRSGSNYTEARPEFLFLFGGCRVNTRHSSMMIAEQCSVAFIVV